MATKQPQNSQLDKMSIGCPPALPKPKAKETKIRGTGAATKGIKARGPMA